MQYSTHTHIPSTTDVHVYIYLYNRMARCVCSRCNRGQGQRGLVGVSQMSRFVPFLAPHRRQVGGTTACPRQKADYQVDSWGEWVVVCLCALSTSEISSDNQLCVYDMCNTKSYFS